jgi:periplasmic divalent cation tolerance protein
VIALVQATFPDHETALAIGRALVEERLAACVNVLGVSQSVYRWVGAVEEAVEVVVQFKTAPVRVGRLVARLTELHPYDLPVVEHWLADADAPAKRWVEQETG